jgi:hypothetical protein
MDFTVFIRVIASKLRNAIFSQNTDTSKIETDARKPNHSCNRYALTHAVFYSPTEQLYRRWEDGKSDIL